MLHRERALQELLAHDGIQPALAGTGRFQQYPLAASQPEGDIESRERQTLHEPRDVTHLSRIAAYKLAARRNVEEEVPHFHRGSQWMRGRPYFRDDAAIHF